MFNISFESFINQFDFKLNTDSIDKLLASSYVYLVCTDKVLVGKMKDAEICFYEEYNPEFVRELRIFNREGEYKAIYSSCKKAFISRVIFEDNDFFENKHFVFGENIIKVDNNFTLVEQDGKTMAYPIIVDAQKKFLVQLINYDYYDFNKSNVMYLKDNRMVDLVPYVEG